MQGSGAWYQPAPNHSAADKVGVRTLAQQDGDALARRTRVRPRCRRHQRRAPRLEGLGLRVQGSGFGG